MSLDAFNALTPVRPAKSPGLLLWSNPAIAYRILGYLSIPDLVSLTRVSKRFRFLIHDETIWTSYLHNIGLENSIEAVSKPQVQSTLPSAPESGATLLDLNDIPSAIQSTTSDLFTFEPTSSSSSSVELSPIDCFDSFKYKQGHAREAFMKLYRTLLPYYLDLTGLRSDSEPLVFQAFRLPLDQAKVLKNLKTFANVDPNEEDHQNRLGAMRSALEMFESAALHEFENSIDTNNVESLIDCVTVLTTLSGSDACVQLYLQKSPLFVQISSEAPEDLDSYFYSAVKAINESTSQIDAVFPESVPVSVPLLEQLIDDKIMLAVRNYLDDIYEKGVYRYLKSVPVVYDSLLQFAQSIKPGKNSGVGLDKILMVIINDQFHNILQSYLSEEESVFCNFSESEVTQWQNTLHEQETEAETFLWSSVSKEKEKRDFLSTFKKVFSMPAAMVGTSSPASTDVTPNSSTTTLPATAVIPPTKNKKLASLTVLPTTELDAMVAVMDNKLEGIRTLFSLELAISLIKKGKEAIERISHFAYMLGDENSLAKRQCEMIFVKLVQILGGKHIMGGFGKALDTLNRYDPKKFRKTVETDKGSTAVEPLAIFAELINIGDLIQQMIHVFFEEELAQRKFIDKNNFMSPAVNAKKKFEQQLDDAVANGLNRGIDVLIDQVDFTFVTQQPASDFNPPPSMSESIDIGPTDAAVQVVSLLSSHMTLLQGSTDKSVIDVFQQEVGHRFYGSICKQMKRKVVNTTGAIKLISDLNYYYSYIASLKQKELLPYFAALKEVGQLMLIDGHDAKALGQALSDLNRFRGVMKSEELLEFVQQRADWLIVKKEVEKVMYGFGVDCVIM